MKKIHFNLSSDDVKALCCTLEVMPAYDFLENDIEADLSLTLASSSGRKLILHEQLTNRETCFVALAVDCAFKALRGELSLDEEGLSVLRPYMFTINKLHPVFSPLLNEGSV